MNINVWVCEQLCSLPSFLLLFSQYIISKMAWQQGAESNLCLLIWVHFYLPTPKADLNPYFI